jgi:hypothetical protein
MDASSSARRPHRLLTGVLAVTGAAAVLGLVSFADPDSSPARPRTATSAPRTATSAGARGSSGARVTAAGCPTGAAAARSRAALLGAERRFRLEAEGAVIHRDLRQIAQDKAFVEALSAHDLPLALEYANRQLVRHVVRIRVLRGSSVLVDANPTSFDVGGSSLTLRNRRGATLGTLAITVQDVIGFDKLVHKLIPADVVVRSANGQMRTTLPAAAGLPLPSAGCVRVGARTYAVATFTETGFTGEQLTISVLTPA